MQNLSLLIASLTALLFGQTAIAQEKVKLPKTPPPQFQTLIKLDSEKQMIELALVVPKKEGIPIEAQIHSVHMVIGYKNLAIYDAAGKKLTLDEFGKRAKIGSVVLVSHDFEVDPAYLRVLKAGTLILAGVGQPIDKKVPPIKKLTPAGKTKG